MIFQAGDSDEGREFAAATADAIFSRHGTLGGRPAVLRATSRDVWPATAGRPTSSRSCPAATFVLGDTEADAQEQAALDPTPTGERPDRHPVPRARLESRPVAPTIPTARCPTIDPDPRRERDRPGPGQRPDVPGSAGRPPRNGGSWPRPRNLSIRELMIEVTGPAVLHRDPGPGGRARSTTSCRRDAADGFILVPHVTPGRPRRVRRQGGPAAPGAGPLPRPSTPGPTLRDHLELPPGPAGRGDGGRRAIGRLTGDAPSGSRSTSSTSSPIPSGSTPGRGAAQRGGPGAADRGLRLPPVLVRRTPPEPGRGRDRRPRCSSPWSPRPPSTSASDPGAYKAAIALRCRWWRSSG